MLYFRKEITVFSVLLSGKKTGSHLVTMDISRHLAPEGNKAAVSRLDDPQPDETQAQPKKEGSTENG